MNQEIRKEFTGSEWSRSAAGAGVEAILFGSVQAVMVACIVVVAAQLFAVA